MNKLVARFEAVGTLENAERLLDYIRLHPMALAMIDTYAQTWIEVAEDMVDAALDAEIEAQEWEAELELLD